MGIIIKGIMLLNLHKIRHFNTKKKSKFIDTNFVIYYIYIS